jgi:hypothetical protein
MIFRCNDNERQTIFLNAAFENDNPADQASLLRELMHYSQWRNVENIVAVEACWNLTVTADG